jgi:hypothetical protein
MNVGEVEQRLQRLEDIEAIKQLKARYCEICDSNHDPERIASVFAKDGIWESISNPGSGQDGLGIARGHEQIRELFTEFQKLFSFSQHNLMNPVIEVDGSQARGSWYLFGPFTMRESNEATWGACRYRDDYEKIGGQWKHKHLRAEIQLLAPYGKGWAR